MKCPLMVSGYRDRVLDPMRPATDCLKEECAWWHEGQKKCVIWGVKTSLDALMVLLAKLVDKMPHELQFRK